MRAKGLLLATQSCALLCACVCVSLRCGISLTSFHAHAPLPLGKGRGRDKATIREMVVLTKALWHLKSLLSQINQSLSFKKLSLTCPSKLLGL